MLLYKKTNGKKKLLEKKESIDNELHNKIVIVV